MKRTSNYFITGVLFTLSNILQLPYETLSLHVTQITSVTSITPFTCLKLASASEDCTTKTKSSNKKKRQPNLPWITCVTALELQRAIQTFVRPGDHVLELGSLLSETTEVLCNQIESHGRATLLDIARKEPSSGRSKGRDPAKFLNNPAPTDKSDELMKKGIYADRVQFEEIQNFQEWRRVLYNKERSSLYDVVIVDMGAIIGNDLTLTTVSVIQEIIAHQNLLAQKYTSDHDPFHKTKTSHGGLRAILIKSTALSSLSRRLIHAARLMDGVTMINNEKENTSNSQNQLKLQNQKYHEPILIASVGVDQYRKTIPFVVKKNDAVLEVGCHFGTSTVMLHKAATTSQYENKMNTIKESVNNEGKFSNLDGFCIGIDIGPKVIKTAQQNYPHVPFSVGDAWRTADLMKLPFELGIRNQLRFDGYDVIYADIGGLSGPDGLLESLSLLEALHMALQPRCIVIKSLCMRRLSSSLKPFSEIWSVQKRNELEKKKGKKQVI